MKQTFRILGTIALGVVLPAAVFAATCSSGSVSAGTYREGTCKLTCDTTAGDKLISGATGATGCDTSFGSSAPTCCEAGTPPTGGTTTPTPEPSCADKCSGGTPRDACSTGEFQSFYCSDTKQWCCMPTKAAADAQGVTTKPTPTKTGPLTFSLPACTQSGNCSLDDIVSTGASFANFLTGLSAALFFATFIYGGARYLLSFGDASAVKAGEKAMKGAAFGMAIILFAWTLVNYLVNAVQGKL